MLKLLINYNSCYCRQYTSIVCFFFSLSTFGLIYLFFQKNKWWCPYTLWILLCRFWALKWTYMYYKPKTSHNMDPKCVWVAHDVYSSKYFHTLFFGPNFFHTFFFLGPIFACIYTYNWPNFFLLSIFKTRNES